MKGFIFLVLFSIPISVYAANDTTSIFEARIDYDLLPVPQLSIYGQNLCSSKRQDGLAIVLGGTALADVHCQMIGSLDNPVDLVTASLLHNPLPGDYWLEAIVYSGNTGIAVRFFMTLGATGPQGIQGVKGDQGIQGITGDQGTQGLTGDQGIQGLTGDQGIQGITGIQGSPGLTGDQGIQGLTGDQGNPGVKGDQGLRGNTGNIGPAGIMGMQGDKGEPGDSGIALLAATSCAEDEYLAGFQANGELLCRTLLVASTSEPTPTVPTGDEPDPDFATACFSVDNDETINILGNDWFDSCVKPNATSLRILVKDTAGNTVYDESAAVSETWSNDNITSTASMTSQHITGAHDQILTMTNNDKMIITGKNSASTTGCFSSYANGYGLVVYSPGGASSSGIRLLLMGYEHGVSGGRRSLSGWTESNELTYSASAATNTCDGASMAGSALTGSVAIFVE